MSQQKHSERAAEGVKLKPAETARDQWLDRALEDSFPASDPVAAHIFD